MAKSELDYFDTEIIPWKPIEGSPGQYEKILSKDPETGSFIINHSPVHLFVTDKLAEELSDF
jgi:hypothetical protein